MAHRRRSFVAACTLASVVGWASTPDVLGETTPEDLSGVWRLEVTTPAGSGNATLRLEQDGDRITGAYSGSLGYESLEGRGSTEAFELRFTTTQTPNPIEVTYSGALDGNSLRGTVVLGSLGKGTFSGQKQEGTPSARQDPWNAVVSAYSTAPPPQSREFDFLIGEWDVDMARYDPLTGGVLSRVRATQDVRYRNDGRIIVDEFTGYAPDSGEKVTHGLTIRTWSPVSGRWEFVFLGSHLPAVRSSFSGGQADGEMRFLGDGLRIRFFDIEADRYRWRQEITVDGGQTWLLERSYTATRRES